MVCKIVKALLHLVLDILDFTIDWMLYDDFNRAEKGLVFGAPDVSVVHAFLAFSVIGTITFIVEITILFMNCKKDGDLDNLEDIVSIVVIWFEDIPQVLISFYVALCRQDAVSGFQVAKAIIVLIGIVVRIGSIISNCCQKGDSEGDVYDPEESNMRTKCTKGTKGLFILGVVLEAGFSIAILCLTYTGLDSQGQPVFRSPDDFLIEKVEDQAYFTNVGLFVHHSELFDMGKLDPDKTDSVVNWLHLNLISGLKDDDEQIINNEFNIQYEKAMSGTMFLAVWIKSRKIQASQWMLSGCYSIDPSTPNISILPSDTCKNGSVLSSTSDRLMMKFRFEKPDKNPFDKKRYIGEIFGGVKLWKNGKCGSMEYAENVNSEKQSSLPMTFHYFKINDKTVDPSTAGHFVNEKSSSPRFFRNDGKDMESVSSAVKTGWSKCDYTGSVSPVYDDDMEVDCHF